MESKEIKIRINSKIFWYLIFILIIIFLGIVLKRTFFIEKYVGVYFLNGELYFGKISYFPKLKLIDPYIFRLDQQTGNNVLLPLIQLPWQPKNFIYLNKNQILWISPLSDNSPVLTLIKNRLNQNQFLPQQQSPAANQFIQNQPPTNQQMPINQPSINQNINNRQPSISEESE